jgi:hypothetical protein
MKKIITILVFAILTAACSSKKDGNMIVQGKIKGLKKGTLYLQKMKDTVLVSVDSVAILGKNTYKLTDNIEAPELFFLTFKGSNVNERILFFGEEGVITINDKIEKFGLNPEISGSKNQVILEKFNKINKGFINKRLDFIQKDFEAKKSEDKAMMKQLDEDYKKLTRRNVLFVANFAISNSEFEVAPYIGLTELYSASTTILDTVHNSLSEKVKQSIYGKRFEAYITNIKKNEIAANK